ncbi:MAG: hypothetical protein AAB464_00235 [Patescibacteria group bacterium]
MDSNIFIAGLNKDDSLHNRAKAVLRNIGKQNLLAITSNFIINEVITVLSQRVSKTTAITFANFIYDSDTAIDIMTINRNIEIKAIDYLKNLKSKNISFCDCATFAILNLFNIDNIATFDRDFRLKSGNFKIMN